MTTSNDPDQIRAEIERTRAGLSQDVDLLQEKVAPSQILDRRVQRAKGRASGLKERVMGSVHHAGDTTGGAAQQGVDSARSAAGSLQSAAGSAAGSASDAVRSAPGAVVDQTQGNPLAAGLIAFGVGWLLGSVISPSQRERQLAGTVREKAQPVLADKAKEVAGDLKEPVQQAAQDLAQSAQASVAEVKDHAQSSVEEVRDHAQSSVEEVKDHAQSAAGDVRSQATS